MIASLHAEVSCDVDILVAHDKIDLIEKCLYEKMGIMTVIHMDPIETNNELLNSLMNVVKDALIQIDVNLSLHDFRMVSGESHTNLIFDVVVPYELKLSNDELKQRIDSLIQQKYPNYYTVITFDREFH